MLIPGTIVEFKDEWVEPHDEEYDFIVLEDREDTVLLEVRRKDGCDPSIIPTTCVLKTFIKGY